MRAKYLSISLLNVSETISEQVFRTFQAGHFGLSLSRLRADSFRGMSPPENDWHVYVHGAKSGSIVGPNVGVLCSRQMLKSRLNPIKSVIGARAAPRKSDSRSRPAVKENRLLA